MGNNQLTRRRRWMTASTFALHNRRSLPFNCLQFSHISHSSHTNRRRTFYMTVRDFWVSIANCIHIWCNRMALVVPCCSSSIHFSLSVSKQNINCRTTTIMPRSLNTYYCSRSHWRHCFPSFDIFAFVFESDRMLHRCSACQLWIGTTATNSFCFVFNFKRT